MKKILTLTFTILLLMLSSTALGDNLGKKTVVVVLDSLDFETSKRVLNENLSMGLLNIRGSEKNLESLFMSVNSGRRVKVSDGRFKGIKRQDREVVVNGYKDITDELDKSYPNFLKQISLLGESLKDKDIKTSFIGKSDREEILMITDKEGKVNYWDEELIYSRDELLDQTEDMLRISDCLLISFDIREDKQREALLREFLKEMKKYNLIVFSKSVSKDLNYKLNDSLVPIFYSGNGEKRGVLTSNSTKRDSVVSSLDISPTILSVYNLKSDSNIGHEIKVIESKDIVTTNQDTLTEFLNLNIIKYIFHISTIALSSYIAYMVFLKKEKFKKVKTLLNAIILSIPLSILLGILHLHRSTLLYLMIICVCCFFILKVLEKKNKSVLNISSVITNLLILLFAFLNPNVLYNSFIGYNNIVAGGRYYGFNNEIMGVFITTSLIGYFESKKWIKGSKINTNIFLIAYFPLVILTLSGGVGANFGGFLTAISVFLILLYVSLFDRKINKKTIVSLLAVGVLILVSNLYMDMKNDMGSHAGSLIERISLLGIYEFIDMILKKIRQLFFMTIVPPWSIVFLSQTYIVLKKFKYIKQIRGSVDIELVVMFVSSLIALLINDTGVVAFMYMNIYLIDKIIEE